MPDEFLKLAVQGNVIPVTRHDLAALGNFLPPTKSLQTGSPSKGHFKSLSRAG
jgi:hypothetical protein